MIVELIVFVTITIVPIITYLNIWINTLERSEADAVVGFVSDNTVLHKLLKL